MSFEKRSYVIFGAPVASGALGDNWPRSAVGLLWRPRPIRLDTLSGELHAEACSVEARDSATIDRCLTEASESMAPGRRG